MAEHQNTITPGMREFARGYFVTRDGRVFSTRPVSGRGAATKPRELAQRVNHKGYAVVGNWRVNRAIAIAWIGQPPTPSHEARHLDGIRLHNTLENIAWGTPKQNCADRKRHGTQAAPPTQVLTLADASSIIDRAILRLHGSTVAVVNKRELSEEFCVSNSQVRGLVLGRSWPELVDKRTAKLSPMNLLRTRIKSSAGAMSEKKAAALFSVPVMTIKTLWGRR